MSAPVESKPVVPVIADEVPAAAAPASVEELKIETVAVEAAPIVAAEEPKPAPVETETAPVAAEEPKPAPVAAEDPKAEPDVEEAAPAPTAATEPTNAEETATPEPAPVNPGAEVKPESAPVAVAEPEAVPVTAEAVPATVVAAPTAPEATPAAAAATTIPTPAATETLAVPPASRAPSQKSASIKEPAKAPLVALTEALPSILDKAKYSEMWGIDLTVESVPATIVLQKFLRANDNNVAKAESQLTEALKWRSEMNPIKQLDSKTFEDKFNELGYVTIHPKADGKETVIAWNIYGAVKDKKATFGNVQDFITWRSAFMELSVRKLKINEATEIIPEGGEDPYQMVQVHDYKGVSFLRMDSDTKAATAETIKVLSTAYPEMLAHKYFVNVPTIMGFVFSIVKRIVSPATVRKFHPISSGSNLASELKGLDIPKEYGGSGASIKEGITVNLAAPATPVPEEVEAPAEAAAPAETPAVTEAAAPVEAPAAIETTAAAEAAAPAEAIVEAVKEDKTVTEKSS
ncbi:hypothetical protein TD95_000928 [Thielaviopsis punctulata]|uniref:Phosphatidylinositol transfer protein SFH5 n=1 Tax=Thielaviopsis punctulata TaxID=72032 RepID=A0A0F4ZG88_9PEZI|nr:hypothetical protein TD95_000928 [Thielaviopsis punctulata]